MLSTFLALCGAICEQHIPLKVDADVPKKKIPRQRRILIRKRRKLSKQADSLKISLQRRQHIKKQLIQLEKEIIQSYQSCQQYQEEKAIKAIKKNSKFFILLC